ncbi:hypothetical protein BDW22DRAFT_439678 [Trametopsis cervina]|nr:hypothetical protein BDW22DRAFT_439678 [Trametopsis cervina]
MSNVSRYLMYMAVMSLFALLEAAFASPIPVELERRTNTLLTFPPGLVPPGIVDSGLGAIGAGAPIVSPVETWGFLNLVESPSADSDVRRP